MWITRPRSSSTPESPEWRSPVLVVLLAPTLPFLTSHDLSTAFWRLVEGPISQREQRGQPQLRQRAPWPLTDSTDGAAPDGLPTGATPPGRPAGAGSNTRGPACAGAQSEAGRTPRLARPDLCALYRPRLGGESGDNRSAAPPWASRGRRMIVGVVASGACVGDRRGVASRRFFASGEPVSTDRPYWVELRSAGELVSLGATGRQGQYTVSSVPDVDAAACCGPREISRRPKSSNLICNCLLTCPRSWSRTRRR